ncbi:MAG: rhomboid family intramembrane serine protease [Pirellulales bacterium]|nr:rhomboid family intramembrane serine protease [Pirellulales bacterium]
MFDELRRLPHPTIVALIVTAAAVFFFGAAFAPDLIPDYGVVPSKLTAAWSDLVAGRWSLSAAAVLLTAVFSLFLHGGVEHILLNMVFLWVFGTLVSEHLGKWWALGVFFLTGVCGNVVQVCLNFESDIPIVGASGAVCGLEGVYLGLALRWRLRWPDVWPLAHPIPPSQLAIFATLGAAYDIYSLASGNPGIAYGAHVGGFVSGLLIAAAITQIFPTDTSFQKSGWRL